jgi:hypothetical protein
MSAHSYRLLEELQLQQDDKTEVGQALLASHNGSSTCGGSATPGDFSSSSESPSNDDNRGYKNKSKRHGHSPSDDSAPASGGDSPGSCPQAQWAANYNPWTDVVQAWSMPFRASGSSVLGPHPPAQQAMVVQQQPPALQPISAPVWDTSTLYAALNNAGVTTQPPPSSLEWYFDTEASSHISNTSGILSSSPTPFQSVITVGNGARLPVTHKVGAHIPTSFSPQQLNNVVVTPSIVKNLVSVQQHTHDNNVSIKFDHVGFSIKDLSTQVVKLRCDSSADLYPLRFPAPQALSTSSEATIELWHHHLGHSRSPVRHQVLHTLNLQCNKFATHHYHQFHVGKNVRLPFQPSETPAFFPFQLIHSDVRTLLTEYFGTSNMFITLWFGSDYGTNPPLGTLII